MGDPLLHGEPLQTRGDIDQAEAMYRKSLSLFESLGAKGKIELISGWIKELTKESQEKKRLRNILKDVYGEF